MNVRWRCMVGAIVLALLVGMPVAVAQDNSAAAEALYNEGVAALDKGDFDTACDKLGESNRLQPAPGTKLSWAKAEMSRGKVAAAWALYGEVRDNPGAPPKGNDRRAEALERLEELEPRLPWLTLRLAEGAPADTIAVVGKLELGAPGFGTKIPIDPGAHVVVVSAPGRETRSYPITMTEGHTYELFVAPGDPL